MLYAFAFRSAAQSNDSVLIDSLVKEIAAMQVTQQGEYFPGMFPSFRECGGAPHNYQPDNNIFFTAITSFGLKNLLPYLEGENKSITQKTIEKAAAVYPLYKNKSGEPFYSFWPSGYPIMPHAYVFQYLKGVFGQGDDTDDTVMIFMTGDNSEKDIALLRKRMQTVSNLSSPERKIHSTYKKYRNLPAHSTYLGTRMPPDFDFAVQCNILYFLYENKLAFNKQDSATLHVVTDMIRKRLYMKNPVYISPYYVKPSILIYHAARLVHAFNIPELNAFKHQLTEDAMKLYQSSAGIMDKIILSTSVLKLGGSITSLNIPGITAFDKSNQQHFVFFQARAAFSYPSPFKQVFLHWNYINYYFYCPAYNKMLWLEYLIERNKKIN